MSYVMILQAVSLRTPEEAQFLLLITQTPDTKATNHQILIQAMVKPQTALRPKILRNTPKNQKVIQIQASHQEQLEG